MNMFLTLAYLFFIGSTLGWVAELLYRRFLSGANPERKWINPGFCVGPYGQYILGKPANGLGNRAIYQPAAS